MIAILAVAGLLITYGALGAGRTGLRARRERRGERVAQAAHEDRRDRITESEMRAAVRVMVLETPEDRASRLAWHADCDEHIAEVNARFDALLSGWPRDDDAPFDPGYWPAVETPELGPELPSVDLAALAEFEPTVVLAIVAEAGAQPTVFSWQTGELPLVERPVCGALSTLRPRRRRATLRRALGASIQPTTF